MPETADKFIARKKKQWEEERGKPLRFKDIGGKGAHYWLREAWILRPQSSLAEKVFTLERLKLSHTKGHLAYQGSGIDEIEYRLGYWIIAKKGHARGKWWWAQHCPLIPSSELMSILTQARREKVIRPIDWRSR